jgi:hypothetical protein
MSEPISQIGAVMNGIGTNLMAKGNPVKGLAMNAAMAAPSFLGTPTLNPSLLSGNTVIPGMLQSQGLNQAANIGSSIMGASQNISPFTPQGVLGAQTVTPGLTGAEQILGQAGQQAMAQSAPLYTGSQGMMDTGGGMFMRGGVSAPIPGAEMSGGGYGALDRIKDAVKAPVGSFMDFAEENPRATQAASQVALANMLQPQPQYQMNTPPAPTPIPSRESVATYVPASLRTQVARNVDPRLQRLYGF